MAALGIDWRPSVKQVDKEGQSLLDAPGKPLWNRIVEFRDKATGEKFEAMVLEALRGAYPELFGGEGAP